MPYTEIKMKPIFYRLILAFGLGSAALSAQAGYICKVDGNAVFTEKKIGNDCTESHTDGTANVSPEEAGRAVPERVDLKEALGEAAPEPGDSVFAARQPPRNRQD